MSLTMTQYSPGTGSVTSGLFLDAQNQLGGLEIKNRKLALDKADLMTDAAGNTFNALYVPPNRRKSNGQEMDTDLISMILNLIAEIMGSAEGASGGEDEGGGGNAMPAAYSPGRGRGRTRNANATFGTTSKNLPAADPRSNPRMQKLANIAAQNAAAKNTRGWCLREVQNSMAAAGHKVNRVGHAFQSAQDFAKDPGFKEVKPPADLRKLPAGAVVVWDRSPAHVSGHISVALGDGREASDHIRPQFSQAEFGTRCRVFYPA